MTTIALLGAAGRLGSVLRTPLAACADRLISADLEPPPPPARRNETCKAADITDLAAMEALLEGVDVVVHFAAIPDERPFETLLGPNYIGAYKVWEAAARRGVRRIVYASSIHAVGMHRVGAQIGVDAPLRPDGYYGLSKAFAEGLASLYYDKAGIEAVCLRIGSCTPEPENERALSTWLSYGDLERLTLSAVRAANVEVAVVYGMSANDRLPIDNAKARFLGYAPRDNAETYAEKLAGRGPKDRSRLHLGGPFAVTALGESGVARLTGAEKPRS